MDFATLFAVSPPPWLGRASSWLDVSQVAHLAAASQAEPSSYAQLVAVLQELGREVRPTYAGNRASSERLRRGIAHARALVKEALAECERAAAAN